MHHVGLSRNIRAASAPHPVLSAQEVAHGVVFSRITVVFRYSRHPFRPRNAMLDCLHHPVLHLLQQHLYHSSLTISWAIPWESLFLDDDDDEGIGRLLSRWLGYTGSVVVALSELRLYL